jgi:hypothetical protein
MHQHKSYEDMWLMKYALSFSSQEKVQMYMKSRIPRLYRTTIFSYGTMCLSCIRKMSNIQIQDQMHLYQIIVEEQNMHTAAK